MKNIKEGRENGAKEIERNAGNSKRTHQIGKTTWWAGN